MGRVKESDCERCLSILFYMGGSLLSVTALINLIGFLFLGWYVNPPSVIEYGDTAIYSNYSSIGALNIRIGTALALGATIWWLSKKVPLILIQLPFIWLVTEFVLWFATSIQMRQTSERLSPSAGSLLMGSTWWDLHILIVTLVSFVLITLRRGPKIGKFLRSQ